MWHESQSTTSISYEICYAYVTIRGGGVGAYDMMKG